MNQQNNAIKDAVRAYLDNRAKTDELFAAAYAKPHKNIDECMTYIIGEAHKMGGQAVYVPDEVVYGWAVHYYDEDEIKIEKIKSPKHTTKDNIPFDKLSDEEKEKAMNLARNEYRIQCLTKIKAEEEAKAAKAAERKKAKMEQANAAQQSLFDF